MTDYRNAIDRDILPAVPKMRRDTIFRANARKAICLD
jgi:hypothetical protein